MIILYTRYDNQVTTFGLRVALQYGKHTKYNCIRVYDVVSTIVRRVDFRQ